MTLKEYILQYGIKNKSKTNKCIHIQKKFLLKLIYYDLNEEGFEYSGLKGRINISNGFIPLNYYFSITGNTGEIITKIETPEKDSFKFNSEGYKTTPKNIVKQNIHMYIHFTNHVMKELKKLYGELPIQTKQNIEKIINDSTPLDF